MSFFYIWEADWRTNTAHLASKEAAKFFLAPQTWRNLRLLVSGWTGAMRSFLSAYPGYFVTPKRMTQSPLESIFR
jgi:hypothetical protein